MSFIYRYQIIFGYWQAFWWTKNVPRCEHIQHDKKLNCLFPNIEHTRVVTWWSTKWKDSSSSPPPPHPPSKVRGAYWFQCGSRASSSQVCIHHISWISRWNFTKLAWQQHWDKPKCWLGFGAFEPISMSLEALGSQIICVGVGETISCI